MSFDILAFGVLPLGRHAVFVVVPIVAQSRRLGFAVIVASGGGESRIIRINTDFAPILCCTGIINARQATAIVERIRADACDAVGNGNARQAIATVERIRADAGDAISNGHARQATATGERRRADESHAVGNDQFRDQSAVQVQIACIV